MAMMLVQQIMEDVMRVGYTRTGKIIDFSLEKLEQFDSEELFDGYAVFSYLATKELREAGGNHFYCSLHEMADTYQHELLERAEFDRMHELCGIHHSLELEAHAKQLVGAQVLKN